MTEYNGLPFVGVNFFKSERPDTNEHWDYCLRDAEALRGAGHGIDNLGWTVVQTLGSDFASKVTYDAPPVERMGSDKHGWVRMRYEPLNPQQKTAFLDAAQRAIDILSPK